MKTIISSLFTALLIFVFSSINAFNPEKNLSKTSASIEFSKSENGYITFKGILLSQEAQSKEFNYRLTSIRSGQSGSSKSNQAGKVDALPGQKITLSQFSTLIDPNDQWEIILGVYEKERLVSTDTLRHVNMK